MKRCKGLLFGLAGSLVFGALPASAEVIAEYNFVDGSAAATSTLGGMTASAVTFDELDQWTSAGSSPSIDELGFFAEGDDTNTNASGGSIDSLESAQSTGDYITFTIGNATNSLFSISQISFQYTASADGFAGVSSHLLTSATGFTNSDSLKTTTFSDSNGTTPVTVPLSGNTALQNLAGPLEIRIYFSDSTASTAASHRVDDIVIEGTPEPGSLALMAIGGLCILHRRRKD